MPARLLDDKVWWNAERKVKGICDEVAAARAGGGNVLVLAHFEGTLATVETALRTRLVELEGFSLFDSSTLCSTDADGPGKVRADLARAFQAPNVRLSSDSPATRPNTPLSIIVAEHHPMRSRDEQLIQAAETLRCSAQLTFHISLDDPLLVHFSGDSIQHLFKRLGADEETWLSHSLITNAIRRAQEKIESQVPRDLAAQSIDDWCKYNLPGK